MSIYITGLDLDYEDYCEYLGGKITDVDCKNYMFDCEFSNHEIRTAGGYVLITSKNNAESVTFANNECRSITIS